jgi:hypothetical protein
MTMSHGRASGSTIKPALRASSSGTTSRSPPRAHPSNVPTHLHRQRDRAAVSPHREIAYVAAFDPRGRRFSPTSAGVVDSAEVISDEDLLP